MALRSASAWLVVLARSRPQRSLCDAGLLVEPTRARGSLALRLAPRRDRHEAQRRACPRSPRISPTTTGARATRASGSPSTSAGELMDPKPRYNGEPTVFWASVFDQMPRGDDYDPPEIIDFSDFKVTREISFEIKHIDPFWGVSLLAASTGKRPQG